MKRKASRLRPEDVHSNPLQKSSTSLTFTPFELTQMIDAFVISHQYTHELSFRIYLHLQGYSVDDVWRMDRELTYDAENEINMEDSLYGGFADKQHVECANEPINTSEPIEPISNYDTDMDDDTGVGFMMPDLHCVPSAASEVDLEEIVVLMLQHMGVDNNGLGPSGLLAPKRASAIRSHLWGWYANSCAWRTAVELVLARELQWAAVVFEVAMYLDNPDLFVLFTGWDAKETPRAMIEHIAERALGGTSIGRVWAQFYAHTYLAMTQTESIAAYDSSEPATYEMVCALLGLGNSEDTLVEVGCVPYVMSIEEGTRCVSWGEGMHNIIEESGRSLVKASHTFRLARKPGLVQDTAADLNLAVHNATYTTAVPEVVVAAVRAHEKEFPGSVRMVQEKRRVSVVDVLEYFESNPSLAGHAANRGDAVSCRYQPFVMSEGKPWYWDMVSKNVRKVVDIEHKFHTDYYSTIEYGRLCTFIAARRCHGWTLHDVAVRMLREEQELIGLGDVVVGMCPVAGSWLGSHVLPRARKLYIAGNNHSNPTVPLHAVNSYVTYLINTKVLTCTSTQRCMVPARNTSQHPVLFFARFQHPSFCGTGSVYAPHVSWPSVSSQVCMGDVVRMLPGRYQAVRLSFLCGADHSHSITFQSHGYDGKTGGMESGVTISGMDYITHEPKKSVVALASCAYLRFNGIRFVEGGAGVDCLNSTNLVFERCHFDTTRSALYDVSNNVMMEQCTNTGKGRSCLDVILHPVPPRWARWVGYVVTIALYVLLAFMTLFLTSGFSTSEANEWIWRSIIAVTVNIVLLRPVMVFIAHVMDGWRTETTINDDLDVCL
eukprot:PhM_4_TR6216/c0_g1_i1/m.59752